ncbi:MAG: AMP-binding protein [Bacteriovoracaceae bacterium]
MDRQFTNVVEMQEYSCKKFSNLNLFGTKNNGKYEWITYGEFQTAVNYARGGLKKLGIGKGDRVAIISNNSKEWAISAYATYSLGGIFVPLYESQQEQEWEHILKDCEAKVVITSTKKIFNAVMSMKATNKNIQDVFNVETTNAKDNTSFNFLLELGKLNPAESVIPDTNDLMGFIYTSGTTGKPKGVMLSHGNIMSNINCAPLLIDIKEGDCTLSFLPWGHIFGQMVEVHLLIYSGSCTGFAENANTIIENLAEIRPTILFAVPRLFNRIYDGVNAKMKDEGGLPNFLFTQGMKLANKKRANKKLSLPEEILLQLVDKIVFTKIRARFGGRMRFAVSGSAALSVDVAKFIDNLNIKVYEGYGLSETSPLISVNTEKNCKLGSVGKVIPNVRVVIDSSVMSDKTSENEGEIICYGQNVMKGYHNQPEETKKL